MRLACEHYLSCFRGKVDTLILGCTHFPLIQETIKEVLPEVNLVDPTKEAVKEIKFELQNKNLLSTSKGKETVQYFVSDDPISFSESGKIFLGEEKEIEAITIVF